MLVGRNGSRGLSGHAGGAAVWRLRLAAACAGSVFIVSVEFWDGLMIEFSQDLHANGPVVCWVVLNYEHHAVMVDCQVYADPTAARVLPAAARLVKRHASAVIGASGAELCDFMLAVRGLCWWAHWEFSFLETRIISGG